MQATIMRKQKHSALGVISFIASIILLFSLLLLIIIAQMDTRAMQDGFILQIALPPIFFLVSILATFVSLITGVLGIIQNDKKIGFAVAGTILSFLGACGLIYYIWPQFHA